MSNGIRAGLLLAFLTALVAACDAPPSEVPLSTTLQVVRNDPARNHLWVLEREGLSLHDGTSGRRLKRFELPGWSYIGPQYAGCAPDLVVDRAGIAFVSSNATSVLWRIDAQRGEVSRVELTLASDGDKDVGFSRLSFSADGTLLAAGTTFESQWRIDVGAARATRIAADPSLTGACDSR